MYVGIDLGGTKIAAGLFQDGKLLKRSRRETEAHLGKAHVLAQLRAVVGDVAAGKRITGIGIGVPGLYKGTRIVKLANIPCLDGVDLRKALGATCRVVLENDARCFALAEHRNERHLVGIIIGTGLGGGFIVDGKLLRGASGFAGEIGHTLLDPTLPSYDERDQRGDWEALLSGRAIHARYIARGGSEPLASAVWRSSERAAKETRAETTRALAVLCASLIKLFDPERIVLGGGVANATLVREANALLPRYGCKPIVRLSRVKDAGLLGAAKLVAERR